MDLSIAAILAQDGVTSGAIYALLALALVLVFSVTRVIFIPQGEFVAYGALTLAAIQANKAPLSASMLVALGVRTFLVEMGRTLLKKHPDADTIFLPSMQWPTIEAIAPLEQEFSVNVITATQAAIWDGLRLAGVTDRIEGYGRLLSEF